MSEQLNLRPPKEKQHKWQSNTPFWQIFTGYQRVFGQSDIGKFFSNNQLSPPPSELRFFKVEHDGEKKVYRAIQNPILAQPGKPGFSPQEVLHQSWLGIQDSLRMYVFDEEGLEAFEQKFRSLGIPFESLKTSLGIMVKTKIPAIVKDENEEIKKAEVDGVVFFLNEQSLQTPADALALADTIAKLHPETAKNLMSSLLTKTRIVSFNIQVWKEVLTAYETGQLSDLTQLSQLPQSLQDIFNQIKSYLETIPSDLATFEQGLAQRLGTTPLSDINLKNSPLPTISENKVRKHLRRILEIASKEQENPERLQRLLRRLKAKISQTPPIVNEAYQSIDPKKWLLTEVAARGQQLMLDRMKPSDGMILQMIIMLNEQLYFNNENIKRWAFLILQKREQINSTNPNPESINKIQQEIDKLRPMIIELLKQQHPDKTIPENIRQWIETMQIREVMTKLRKKLLEAETTPLDDEEKQKIYQENYKLVEQEIQRIVETETTDETQTNLPPNQFPPHPVLQKWNEVEEKINNLSCDEAVKQKLIAVFRAKKQLAAKQKDYTNLFLLATIKNMHGGYDGWNERLKGVLEPLLETSPYFASLFEEPNCVGRMILLSAMLMDAQVFEEKDLVTMAIYDHSFLGGFDALGVGRVIEGSGQPKHSYFGIPKEKVFQGKVFNNQEIIFQFPLKVGLITEVGCNYSAYLKKQQARELMIYLLQQSGYIQDALWNNLFAYLLSNSANLDSFFSLSRAASINNLFSTTFYFLLYKNELNIYSDTLRQQTSSPLLPYIKLNLLVMRKALEDEENAEELQKRINDRYSEFKKEDIQKMKNNLESFLSQLDNSGVEIPAYWLNRYGPRLENATIKQMRDDLWNPDLFPKPIGINDNGLIEWEMPEMLET